MNPNGGPPLPWVSEIRIPGRKETNTKTGKYTPISKPPGSTRWHRRYCSTSCKPLVSAPGTTGGPTTSTPRALYWCINPVTPSHLETYGSDYRRKTGLTRDVDIVARYWLPIDADALRVDRITGAQLSVVSSTSTEKASIGKLISIALDWLCGTMGWPEPVSVDTGNGYALYYALPGIPIPRVPDPEESRLPNVR